MAPEHSQGRLDTNFSSAEHGGLFAAVDTPVGEHLEADSYGLEFDKEFEHEEADGGAAVGHKISPLTKTAPKTKSMPRPVSQPKSHPPVTRPKLNTSDSQLTLTPTRDRPYQACGPSCDPDRVPFVYTRS
ncbi:hypothetical protein BGX24_003165 [Mortierella sp. AD032]|nr:hypothetical protein BGX24_003165 [Mortierella sp. AD032]